jgi:aminoglycoside phosphotransferase (APT) family kinase protein
MFSAYGVRGAWQPLASTGIANWIYATEDVVLRVATDHRDGVPDARTESVAAPAAYAAGILTPRLIAFDDSRTLVDRPFSLWERIHGGTLGEITLPDEARSAAWRAVGRELARLHRLVTACPDPHGYLDVPGEYPDVEWFLAALVDGGRLGAGIASDLEVACRELDEVPPAPDVAFTHGDAHAMNIMCDEDGRLLALIDWGDAGWSDPMHDFSSMPLDVIPSAVAGYETEIGRPLDDDSLARLVRAKVISAFDHFVRHADRALDGEALRRFVTKRGGPAS